ncbi:uncharacterized protein LOC120339698 isoform X2 [Styela clava]
MSRRKQTKPFKVEEKPSLKRDKKPKLRNSISKLSEEHRPSQRVLNSGILSDGDETGRPKRGTKCNQCGKVLASSLSLARHKLTHSESKPYQCPRCDAGFKTSSNMHRHLRIHFREEKEEEVDVPLPRQQRSSSNQRTPRQNMRTPNKYKEFDVDLVGVGPRVNDNMVTNARSYSKPRDSHNSRNQASRKDKNVNMGSLKQEEKAHNDSSEDLPDLNLPRRRGISESSKAAEDLVCHVCNKTFISKFGLLTHAITHPETDSTTKCHRCDQSFSTPKGLTVHNVIVHKIAKSKQQKLLDKHENRGFKDISIVDFSANKFPVVAEAACTQSHRSQSLRDTQHIFVCKKCGNAFPLLQALELHMMNVHWNSKKDKVVPKFSELTNFFTSLDLYDTSKTNLTPKDVKQVISSKVTHGIDDDFIYTSETVAIEDIPSWLKVHPDLDASSYLKESEVEFTPPRLRHIKRKLSSNNYDDRLVEYVESDGGNGYRLQSKRKSRNYASPGTIPRRFEDSPQQGDNKASGERNVFWCRICNYSSHEKSALVRHLLTHSGIRPYFCKICDYAFTTKANCERHVRKRHNRIGRAELDAAVKCDWEMLKNAPKDDIYMISGSNSSCPVCNKSFSCNNELKQHLKEHEEKQFICQVCNIRCTTHNNCVRHILQKHPDIPQKEINNIIIFTGTRSRRPHLKRGSDAMNDGMIDISRGHLGRRKSLKHSSSMLKSRTKHLSQDGPPLKQQRLSANDDGDSQQSNIADDEDSNIPMSLPETGEWKKQHEQTTKSQKFLPLIPLLKIKAYNEAATRSYTDMVAFYQNLNFFNNNINDPLDDTIVPMADSPVLNQDEENMQGMETAFICQSCSTTFNTEDELTNHILTCTVDNADVDDNIVEKYKHLMTPEDDYANSWKREDYFGTKANNMNDEWLTSQSEQQTPFWERSSNGTPVKGQSTPTMNDISLLSRNLESPSQLNVFENSQVVEQWINNSSQSSFADKSMDSEPAQEFDQIYNVDGPRVFASSSTHATKESSYVEDSLLMSMFGDEGREKEFVDDDTDINNQSSMAISRYTSSLPTMVNMKSAAMSRMRYQGSENQFGSTENSDDKLLAPNKGKYFSGRKCPQCDKTFPWASSLRRHIMTHTGLKLYMCRLCKMRFTTRSNLIRHVYRRHGMAKQHPDFSSCLAKLHPSDTLLREVEADVRRRVDGSKKGNSIMDSVNGEIESNGSLDDGDNQEDNMQGVVRKKKGFASDYQSMLEEDPETLLVDLDYSPRDELGNAVEGKKLKSPSVGKSTPKKEKLEELQPIDDQEDQSTADTETETSTKEKDSNKPLSQMSDDKNMAEALQQAENKMQLVPHYHRGKNLRRRSDNKSQSPAPVDSPTKNTPEKTEEVKESPASTPTIEFGKTKGRNKQSTQYVCGLCKKIFKTVPDLISHLDIHDVPHAWHCPECSVPFTNKYNCQRHLSRRHGRSDLQPIYVEDLKHGPRNARGRPLKSIPDSPSGKKDRLIEEDK